ncbi:MAG: hypothetical protein A3F83_04130 [Candidatus Glassbacteria bacterium RIFCSPLOWO2_12_FULL_58_11]|uniref:Putative glutamine amidotransferase domain-containing protein n=1 Tax=Candidatus Glassbacteria bacterium RIFCSPLOWO2_12_FULL_58_11 TaxID=1817867 RepID=A0A1F5YSS7_9BACT|nr:MAG: hypothetical protein A3F83_04130 [Candidatus Glassbacteria bacterium RIFCSPLOWO2_12_FULL_58_11]
MPENNIVYLGDDSLKGAAAYLGGVLTQAGQSFSYVPTAQPADPALLEREGGLIILSDYPAENLKGGVQEKIAESVRQGASLLMIGGWESFYGVNGGYETGPISAILPVTCKKSDDRMNYCQGAIPWVEKEHPCLEGLPWHEPPVFCGFNETALVSGAELVLSARLLQIRGDKLSFAVKRYPLLAFRSVGKGKTCALTTDLAPHWVGGWVDWSWGEKRVSAQAKGGNAVEVGRSYAQFITQLAAYLSA